MYDIVALGEILIDFSPAGTSENGNLLFERNPGGAPANVLVEVAKLGGKTAFIGKVGKDMFGDFLIETLENHKIDISGVQTSVKHNTTLAFIQLDEDGERSFSFYRNHGADIMLHNDEVDFDIIKDAKIFHFGSISLTDEPIRSSTINALKYVKNNCSLISYDPNLRPPLWTTLTEAKEKILSVMHFADIIKLSIEELEFLTGISNNMETAVNFILNGYQPQILLVTMGKDGCFYQAGDTKGEIGGFAVDKTFDTTGAGDAFLGGFLYYCTANGIFDFKVLEKSDIEKIIEFANASAALCVLKKGAIPAMPALEEVYQLLCNR